MSTRPAMEPLPVAIIGAGPVGLAAAAHLADRGQAFMVFEHGPTAGAAVAQWATSRSSRRGDMWSTTQRTGCSNRPAGPTQTPISTRPAAN